MIVESKAGGVDIYSDPDLNSTKLNDSLIPNGTALRIEGEVEDEKDNRLWGYTQYHGMYGYVPEDELKPAQSRQEAIDSELYIAGSDNVDYNTDYDVTVDSDEDGINLYQGPGEKYGAVPEAEEIKNGETLHIVQEAEMVDGSRWGVTDSLEKDGWVNLDETREEKNTGFQKEDVDGKTEPDTTEIPETAAVIETPSVGNVEIPEAEEKTKLTEAEDESESPSAEAAELKDTKEAEEKAEPTKAEEKDEKMAQEETAGNERKAEPTETPGAADAASREVQTDTAPSGVPLVFIILAAVAAVGGLFIYHFRKR